MKKFKTADLCDAHYKSDYENKNIVITKPIGLKNFGGISRFYGQIQTLKCFEDHSGVENMLSKDGTGKVLLIDGKGSLHCALVGDKLASLAIKNNWNGIIVNGAIRDSATIRELPIGLRALGTCPVTKVTDNVCEENGGIHFADTYFWSDQFIYCDEDGIIISKTKLL